MMVTTLTLGREGATIPSLSIVHWKVGILINGYPWSLMDIDGV